MHDRRREIEDRLDRALDERIRPATHTTLAPVAESLCRVNAAPDSTAPVVAPFLTSVSVVAGVGCLLVNVHDIGTFDWPVNEVTWPSVLP